MVFCRTCVSADHASSSRLLRQPRVCSRRSICRAVGRQHQLTAVQAHLADCTLPSRRSCLQTLLPSLGLLLNSQVSLPAWAGLVDEDNADSVFQSAYPSVVSIVNSRRQGNADVEEGTGSGLVWDNHGHIVTNYHCIAQLAKDKFGTQETRVGLAGRADGRDGQDWPATIVGTDPNHDLAVLRIEAPAEALKPVQLGTSNDLKVGQSLYAIGFPYGLSRTLTAGVVSGLNRDIPNPAGTKTRGAIQTDAAISQGNSGGPLLDSAARVVGINTATFTRQGTGRSSGVNFAIPMDLVYQIVPQLMRGS
ncbi:hypothetical protein WJX74_005702 [Apatococcus lobatus]|uniref:Serine protease n=1 Tax=Apatococcus lobatus TaxID=904363 RepID=A0AAW1QH34_9CHLO